MNIYRNIKTDKEVILYRKHPGMMLCGFRCFEREIETDKVEEIDERNIGIDYSFVRKQNYRNENYLSFLGIKAKFY